MHPYPHTYTASAAASQTGMVTITSPQLPDIESASPPEFDGLQGIAQFTQFKTFAKLQVRARGDIERAHGILERAESGCLIANSVRGTRTLDAQVTSADG